MPKHSLAIAYSMKKKNMAKGGSVPTPPPTPGPVSEEEAKKFKAGAGFSKGGDVKGVHRVQPSKGRSLAGELVRGARQGTKEKHQQLNELAKTLHEQKLDELKEDKGDRRNLAHGGEVDPMQEVTCPHCAKTFSHGGEVANDTEEGVAADELPNEFDDLVLDGDEEMEGYTGKNSGDLVGRAMAKRKAKK